VKFALASLLLLLAAAAASIFVWTAIRVRATSAADSGALRGEWSASAAAIYLDSREAWWRNWHPAQLGGGAACISCHTVLPYVLVRPALRAQLGETGPTAAENSIREGIEERVTDWQTIQPYYPDPAHATSSRATEAVLNALTMAAYNAGRDRLSPLATRAFDNAWALQETAGESAGGWQWQDFHLAPWESNESAYQGAALMAIAVGMTPKQYRSKPEVRHHVEALRDYLRRSFAMQPAFNQLYVMWASAQLPQLLSDTQRNDLIAQVGRLQHPDGGWSLAGLDKQTSLRQSALALFQRIDKVDGSDGCATGLAVLALEEDRVPLQDPVLLGGLTWLRRHQREDGSWWASSMNGLRNPATGTGKFMSDAATGYATMALEDARSLPSVSRQ
jgi:squalene-hopene/tetraprenyl-beta-curcumene cyclase